MLKRACSGKEAPGACHPPSALWQPLRFGQWPISTVLTAWPPPPSRGELLFRPSTGPQTGPQ